MNEFEGNINSKLPKTGNTIFSIMSAMARQHNAINLSQGFPDFNSHPHLIEAVHRNMQAGHNQYAPMPGIPDLRQKIAEKVEKCYGAVYDPDREITVTAGATQAISTAISTFVGEDDEVVIFEPAYDAYAPCITLNKGRAVYYTMQPPHYAIDWKQVVKLLNSKTKMLIINTPHNPSGTVLRDEDMLQLAKMLDGTDIILLSDEVYEHMVFDENKHQSACRFPGLLNRTLCISSFGKTYHTTGWKMGYCLGPANLMHEFRKVYQYTMFCAPTPLQHAFAEILEDPVHYEALSAFYQNKRDLFADAMANSRFNLLNCHGTYFQCADYGAISDKRDTQFAEWLTKEVGVAVIPLSPFYRDDGQHTIVRFCFAKEDDTLKKAADILCKI